MTQLKSTNYIEIGGYKFEIFYHKGESPIIKYKHLYLHINELRELLKECESLIDKENE